MSTFRVRYQTYEFGSTDIHMRTLRDTQEFSDDEGEAERLGISSAFWSLFGQVWESGEVLARVMYRHEIEGLKVLEIGCGMGLASLVLKGRHADITATDHHPEAGAFLEANTELNHLRSIRFVRTGWQEESDDLGLFDLVIGSDLLYEADNVLLVSGFINRHASATCTVIMVDPGRGLQGKFTRAMSVHGFSDDLMDTTGIGAPASFKGRVLRYSRPAVPEAGEA